MPSTLVGSLGSVDQVISDIESTAVRIGSQQVVGYLAANVWAGLASPFISPVLSYLVSIVVSILIQKLDWMTYMLLDGWENTQEAKDYINAAEALENLPPQASAQERSNAEQAKIDAFKKLIGMGSPPFNGVSGGSEQAHLYPTRY